MNDDFSKLTSLLRRASREDRANLAKILDIEGADKPEQIAYRFHELRAGVIGQFFSGHDYKQLVTDVADHVGVDWDGLLRGRPWERLATPRLKMPLCSRRSSCYTNRFLRPIAANSPRNSAMPPKTRILWVRS